MRKMTKLVVLCGVLAALCLTIAAVSRREERKEQIKTSGEVFLQIPAEGVTALSWENEEGAFSFTKEDGWVYDADADFPVDGEKVEKLLSVFESLSAAFVIEEVEDYADYGLDEPAGSVTVFSGEESVTVLLGDFSKMDQQRYVSVGDGKAYLVTHDPMDEFSAVLADMMLDDEIPAFDTVRKLSFSGSASYTIVRDEEAASLCADDVFFAGGRPLDTDRVESYLQTLAALPLSACASYHAAQEELEAFGLAEPELSVTVAYTDGEEQGSFTLHIGRDQKQLLAAQESGEGLDEVAAYVRLGESQIVYELSAANYRKLAAASYDELRHREIFPAAFDSVRAFTATLEGGQHAFARAEDGTWTFDGREIEVSGVESALLAVSASSFTGEAPAQKEELGLVLELENEDFPSVSLSFYRYDGESCLAAVDGETVALVPRSEVVALVEALHAILLAA